MDRDPTTQVNSNVVKGWKMLFISTQKLTQEDPHFMLHILKTIVEWHVIWLQGKIKTYIKTELCEKLGTIADQVFASVVFLDHVYLRQTKTHPANSEHILLESW